MRPSYVFRVVNKLLCEHNEAGMFATAFMGYLDIPTGRFTYVNAGHNPPLIKQGKQGEQGGSFKPLNVRPGFVLAGIKGFNYIEGEVTFEKGDALCLYTDGITETMNSSGELFALNRLSEVADSESVDDLIAFTTAIKEAACRFSAGVEQADDITLLSFRYDGIWPFHFAEFKVTAGIGFLKFVLQRITAPLRKMDCAESFIRKIELAAEEVFVNIAHYAYAPDSGDVKITLYIERELILTFADTGRRFNPVAADSFMSVKDAVISAKAERFSINKSAGERVPGGLGIFITKKLMDNVSYNYESGRNVLTLRKRLP
jgi:sigma-B regulation protein RsbU (phosphoserine phosphatase)